MKKINLTIITLGIAALSLAACDTPRLEPNLLKTTEIIKQNDSQVGILLGNHGEWTVVGIPVGAEFESCEFNKQATEQKDALPSCLPGDGQGKVLDEKIIEFKIMKINPLCVYITIGSRTKKLCSPDEGPYPEALIQSLMPQ